MAKEHSINLSSDEALALLAGNEVRVWCVMRPQPERDLVGAYKWRGHGFVSMDAGERLARHCPYGKVGSTLWGRETHYRGVSGRYDWEGEYISYFTSTIEYTDQRQRTGYNKHKEYMSKRSCTSMPRWASRFIMEIIEVDVRRRDGIWYWMLRLKRIVQSAEKAA